MTITPADIKLLAAARMTDADDGGGLMSPVALQDGAENNVFPDLSSIDRAFGRFQLRKVYGAVLSATTDTLLGANVILEDEPDDANVAAVLFAAASAVEERADAMLRLQQAHWEASASSAGTWSTASAPVAACSRLQLLGGAGYPPAVGTVLFSHDSADGHSGPVLVTSVTEIASGDGTFSLGFPTSTAGTRVFAVTYVGDLPATLHSNRAVLHGRPATVSPRLCATAAVSGALSIGATQATVDSVLVPLVPAALGDTAGGAEAIGIDATNIVPAGVAAGFRGGDAVVVHHTAETTPAAVTNGTTINCGRTNISRATVIGANGASILSGYTVNLAAGTVTATDVTGWSQPVKVRHSIEEVLGLKRTGYPEARQSATAGSGTTTRGPYTLVSSLSMYAGRANVGQIKVYSKTGQDITDLFYPVGGGGTQRWFGIDLTAGTVTVPYSSVPGVTVFDAFVASHSPVTLVASGSTGSTLAETAAQTNPNTLTFNRALTKAFPAGTLVSSVLLMGDLQARVGGAFSQTTWADAWADERAGAVPIGQYNQAGQPIVVRNDGALTERWALIFTSSTAYRVIGEQLGQVTTGDINTACAPVNPATGQPYFTIAAAGWGSGWSGGNVLRFNTYGANAGAWVARITLPSTPSSTPDALTLAVRGDIDA